MKKWLILCVAVMMMCGVALAAGEESSDSALEKIDMTAWQYEEEHDVYWQVGIPYASNPADAAYETMGFFVPGAYFTGTKNDNGTYTCEVNPSGVAAGYTALTAPLVIPVNTPGYAAMQAPTDFSSRMGYGSIEDYTSAGLIVLFAGARGRDAGAPAGVTDFKAAIRYTRYNADRLPGNMDCIFPLGMSGVGAQSALIGATGNSPLYTPYLEEIGAVEGVSDAVMGSMCWCPITNLDVADEAYEWNMGNTRTELTQEEQALSDGMAAAFAQYINSLGLTDENGVALTLTASENGICQSGTYYDYILRTIEESLNHFLTDNAFPYTVASGAGGAGGAGGNRTGRVMPENGEFAAGERNPQGNPFGETGAAPYEALDQINRTTANTAAVTLSGTYNTVQDYIDALNSAGEWVTYRSCFYRKPITPSAVGRHPCEVFRHTQLDEILQFGFRFLPLLPDVCTDSVPHPFIPLCHSLLHRSYRVIVQPSCHVKLDFFHDLPDIHSAIPFGQCAQPVLRLQQRFGMDLNKQPFLSLAVRGSNMPIIRSRLTLL